MFLKRVYFLFFIEYYKKLDNYDFIPDNTSAAQLALLDAYHTQ